MSIGDFGTLLKCIAEVAYKNNLNVAATTHIVYDFLEEIGLEMTDGNKVSIPGFGTFLACQRWSAVKQYRIPIVRFAPSSTLSHRLLGVCAREDGRYNMDVLEGHNARFTSINRIRFDRPCLGYVAGIDRSRGCAINKFIAGKKSMKREKSYE